MDPPKDQPLCLVDWTSRVMFLFLFLVFLLLPYLIGSFFFSVSVLPFFLFVLFFLLLFFHRFFSFRSFSFSLSLIFFLLSSYFPLCFWYFSLSIQLWGNLLHHFMPHFLLHLCDPCSLIRFFLLHDLRRG